MLPDEVVSIGEEEATADSTEPLQDHSSPRQQKSPPIAKNTGGRGVLSSAPGETRTHTGRVLNPLPLPIGLLGLTGRDVSASSHKRRNPRLYPHACLARPAQRTRSASPGPHHGRVGVFE